MKPATRTRTRALLALAVVVAPFAAAACGDDSTGGSAATTTGGAATTTGDVNLPVIAVDIAFDKKAYTAPAGTVRVAYDNKGSLVHSLVFEDPSGNRVPDFRLQAAPGKEVDGSVSLPAGTYTMICDIPGHEQQGMVAKVTVG